MNSWEDTSWLVKKKLLLLATVIGLQTWIWYYESTLEKGLIFLQTIGRVGMIKAIDKKNKQVLLSFHDTDTATFHEWWFNIKV
jgi:hypothetical protein